MSRHQKSRYPIADVAEATAERVRLGGDILIALAHAVAANEETQRKFRHVVINKLTRIEAQLSMVHVSQLARDQDERGYYEERLRKDGEAAEEFISRKSFEAGLAAIKYIYGTEEQADPSGDRRRRWSDWEV